MDKETEFGMAQGTSVHARRSPRILSQRESVISQTLSPLVSTNMKETKEKPQITDIATPLRRSKRVNSPQKTHDSTLEEEDNDKTQCTNVITDTVAFKNKSEIRKNVDDVLATSTTKHPPLNKEDNVKISLTDNCSKSRGRSNVSLQARELRKIEDYWTRRSPSTDQSPRLRSLSRIKDTTLNEHNVNTVSAECSKHNQNRINKSNNFNIPEVDINVASLPESPLPRRLSERLEPDVVKISNASTSVSSVQKAMNSRPKTKDVQENLSEIGDFKSKTKFLGQNFKVTVIRIDSKTNESIPTDPEPPIRTLNIRSNTKAHAEVLNLSERKPEFPRLENIHVDKGNPLTEIIIKDFTDSESEEDDDYIPPRKKLRSEVSTDELWEGFPNFSFKRLAPIRKSNGSDTCKINEISEEKISSSAKERSTCKSLNPAFGNSEGKTVFESQKRENSFTFSDRLGLKTSSTDRNILSSDVLKTPASNSLDPVGLALNSNEETKTSVDEFIGNFALRKDLLKHSSLFCPTDSDSEMQKKLYSNTRKHNHSPNMPLKRSARLQERQCLSPMNDFRQKHVKNDDTTHQSCSVKAIIAKNSDKNDTANKDIVENHEAACSSFLCTLNNQEQSHSIKYTKIKEDLKTEMSILEILSHNYNDQIPSFSSPKLKPICEDRRADFLISDSDSEMNNLQASEETSGDNNLHQDCSAITESVSHTLLNLLQDDERLKERNAENVNKGNTLNVLDNTENETSMNKSETHAPETNVKTFNSIIDHSMRSSSGKTVLTSDKDETEEKKHANISCSKPPGFEFKFKEFDKDNRKKSLPTLRIKLKSKSGHKKGKKRSDGRSSKLQENVSFPKTKNKFQKCKIDTDTTSVKDKSNKHEKKATDKETKDKLNPIQQNPQKNKKSKKQVCKRRKSSPGVSTMELRLNNERRRSLADDILSNPVLDKHACVLWSSENRRHIILSKPDASHEDIDDTLRRKWEQLSDKEKLRYFQRARNAIKDENRHSSRRNEEVPKPDEASISIDPNPTMTRFIMMNPGEQLTELKKWLHFYHDVSVEEYNNVLTNFKNTLQKDKIEREQQIQAENTKNNSKIKKKCKTRKQRKEESLLDDYEAQSWYRKLLFEKIIEVKDKLIQAWRETKAKQKEKLNETFSGMVKKLITGDSVNFSEDVVSRRLTEVLCDIKNLETNKKLGVSGKDLRSESYANLINTLKQELDNVCCEQSTSRNAEEQNKCQDISQASDGDLPRLNPASVQEVFNEINNAYTDDKNCRQTRAITSPSSLLTSLVIADLLEDHAANNEAERNINNNMSHTVSNKHQELKSILNLEDLQRKYCTEVHNGAVTSTVSSDIYLREIGIRNPRQNIVPIHTKSSVSPNRLVHLSNHFISGTRSGIVALQKYDNYGKPVLRYARVKPASYSAARLRMLEQQRTVQPADHAEFTGLTQRPIKIVKGDVSKENELHEQK